LDALNVLAGDRPLYFAANNGREPAYIYLVSLSVAALGRSPLAVRLPAAVLGTLTIPATYALGAALAGRRAGLWAAAITAFTFWPLALSRIGLRAVALPLLVALSLACAARGLCPPAGKPRDGGSAAWLALGGALYGLTFYTYLAARFTPLALLAFLIFWYSAQRSTFPSARQMALFGLPAALAVMPLGLAALGQPEILLGRVGQVSVFNPAIHGGNLAGALFHNSLAAVGMFAWRGDDIARHNLPGRPVFDPLLSVAWLGGVVLAARAAVARRSLVHALILIWTGVMLLPTVLAEDTPHFLRGVGVLPVALLFPALALDWLWSAGGRVVGGARWAARGACLAALAASLGLTARDYFGRYAPSADTGYLFQGAATELARSANVYLAGAPDRQAYLDKRYWDSFAAVRFLLEPSERLHLFDLAPAPLEAPALVVAWPYDDLHPVAASLPAGALLASRPGPLYRGDLELAPYPLYVTYTAQGCPAQLCAGPALAAFEGGVRLVAAETQAEPGGLSLMLTWQADRGRRVQVFAQAVVGEEIVAQADGPLGTELLPSVWWRPGDTVVETRTLRWPSGTAPAGARLRIGLYDPETNARYARLDSNSDFVDLAP
jgi:4-amino-4-deoxy-L-arabinose transferase-like glycosyltransferase